MSWRTTRKPSSPTCARARRSISPSTCSRARSCTVTSTASRPPAARNSRCCRRTTPPAISPRWCSASRCRIALDAADDAAVELRPGMSVIPTIETRSQVARPVDGRRIQDVDQNFRSVLRCPVTAYQPRSPRFRPRAEVPARNRGRSEPRQPHDLDRRARRHDRLVHGDPEHPDHQRLAAQHRGRHRHRRRQRLLDLDLVSDRRDRRDPAHRLSEPGVLVPPLHARERGAVRGVLGRLCLHPRSAVDDRDARPAGLCRRRADPDGVHAGADQAAEAAAADRPRDLRAVGHLRAGDRSDHRRLSHRELRLADHLLRQRDADRGDGDARSI